MTECTCNSAEQSRNTYTWAPGCTMRYCRFCTGIINPLVRANNMGLCPLNRMGGAHS